MPETAKRTFDLPPEQASYIDSLVESGAYASQDEVVRAGLEALQDRDEGIERWLVEEVVPVAEAMEADPGRGIPLEEVAERLLAHRASRSGDGTM